MFWLTWLSDIFSFGLVKKVSLAWNKKMCTMNWLTNSKGHTGTRICFALLDDGERIQQQRARNTNFETQRRHDKKRDWAKLQEKDGKVGKKWCGCTFGFPKMAFALIQILISLPYWLAALFRPAFCCSSQKLLRPAIDCLLQEDNNFWPIYVDSLP